MNKAVGLLLILSSSFLAKANTHSHSKRCDIDASTSPWQTPLGITADQMKIAADYVELMGTNRALFKGDVQIDTLNMQLDAQLAEIDKVLGKLNAKGPVKYTSQTSIISSDSLSANLSDSEVDIINAQYQLTQQIGRGQAQRLRVTGSELTLEDASFTTCPVEKEVWSLHASEIILSQEEGWGETYGTVLRVFDTPVMYLPYFTFPISDKRTSGFIEPVLSSSNRYGVEIKAPFYWNIAPNVDATITPRYMSNIGLQLQTEVRYLTEQHQGLVGVEYLQKDDSEPQLDQRYLFHWQQQSQFNEQWRASIDATNISDDNYLNDLGSDYATKTETQLKRSATLNYLGERWHSAMNIQNFEVLGDHAASYSAFPQVSFNQTVPFKWHDLSFSIDGEIAHFKNSEAVVDAATRIHIEPKVSYQVQQYAWQFLSEVSLLQTNYQQDGDLSGTEYDERVNRTLPKVRLYGQLNFERDTQFIDGGVQTLEPRLQYLYVSNKDQSNIALYDTTKLQEDFFGLFREQRFSGVDRIATANQFTLGATTRIFDNQSDEIFNLSAGQIFYVSDSAKPSSSDEQASNYNALFASEAMLHWHRRWYLSAGIQYDTDGKEIIQSHVTLDYKGDNNQLVQLNHRFANEVSDNRIEQVGVFASVPIDNQWQFIASYQRDLETNRSVEVLTGVQYQSCCWAIQVSGYRQIETDLNQSISNPAGNSAAFDSGIQLKFIKGLDANKLLNQSIFGYRRPYFLNN